MRSCSLTHLGRQGQGGPFRGPPPELRQLLLHKLQHCRKGRVPGSVPAAAACSKFAGLEALCSGLCDLEARVCC